MKQRYDDIIDAVGTVPTWWQENGVPRFCEFSPEKAPDIYADEAALVEIACQACHERYLVCMTTSQHSIHSDFARMAGIHFMVDAKSGKTTDLAEIERKYPDKMHTIAGRIRAGTLHYGDPPNTGCCSSGPSMTSLALRVVEYWSRKNDKYVENGVIIDHEAYWTWERNAEYEVELPDMQYLREGAEN